MDRELRLIQGTVLAALAAQITGISFSVAGGTHHAGSNFAEGFCMLNDQAVAANYLLNFTDVKKVLIIDLDVHQGNGTAEIFQNIPDVFTFSMHGAKNYPFKKEKSDLDVGVDDGISGKEYIPLLKAALSQIKREFHPDFIFYQAGVDVLETDRLGRLKLSKEECAERDRLVFEFCKTMDAPVQVSMGGGYSHEISDIVDAHLQTYRLGISMLKKD